MHKPGLWLHLHLVHFQQQQHCGEDLVPTGTQGPFHVINVSLGEA